MRRARDPRVLLWTAVAAYAAGFSSLAILRHRAFNTGRFDLGNMVQAVWSTAHGDPLAVTDLQGDQIVRLGAHVDPILVLLAPLWRLWPSPNMLLTVQATAVALGAIPVFWLACKHLTSERAALGFALAYLLYPAGQWMTLSDFHPVALACPLLLFAFWYLDEGRLLPFGLCAAVAALGKEHVPLAVAGLGVWYAVSRGKRFAGALIAAAGVAATAFAVGVVVPHFNAGGESGFYSRYREVGGSPGGIARTLVTDPLRLLEEAFDARGLVYLAELAGPILGLPLLAPVAVIAALPELALNLLSATRTQTSVHFHYSATVIPVFFAAAVLGAARIARRRRALVVPLGVAAAVASLASTYALGAIPLTAALPGGESLQSDAWRSSEHDRSARRALALIPADDVVSASNSLGAHLSARERILSFPYVQDARWIAVDETSPGYADRIAPLAMAASIRRIRSDPGWRLVFSQDGVLVFRRAP